MVDVFKSIELRYIYNYVHLTIITVRFFSNLLHKHKNYDYEVYRHNFNNGFKNDIGIHEKSKV